MEKVVFNLLMSRQFERWYEKEFMDFVEGAEGAPTMQEILQWLKQRLPEPVEKSFGYSK